MRVAGYDPTSVWNATRGLTNMTASGDTQLWNQAQSDWVRAKLRRESGASISDDEMAREITTYFPQVGDTEAVIEQKRQARESAVQAMGIGAGLTLDAPQSPRSTPTRRGAIVKWSDLQ